MLNGGQKNLPTLLGSAALFCALVLALENLV
jgi:hypothetical protein